MQLRFCSLLFILFASIYLLSSCVKQKIEMEVQEIVSPATEDLNDVLFVSDSIGFMCGGTKYDHGIVLKTADGGSTWLLDTLTSTKALYDIAYHNGRVYTTGYEGFFYVSDNLTESWYVPGYPYWQRFNQIAFNDLDEIFVGMGEGFDRGEIVFSNNNGNAWGRIDTFNRSIKTIMFHNGVGYAGAYGVIYRSYDDGRSWTATYADGDFFNNIIFTSDKIGYAIGYYGQILKTTDGGDTWKKVLNENFSFSEKSNFRDAYFTSDNEGYVVGDNGYMIKTSNGGKSWQVISKFTDSDLYTIDKVSNYFIVAGSLGKIFKVSI